MKKHINKSILYSTILVVTMLINTSCSEDDLTGRSTLVATNPNLSIMLDFQNNETLIEEETSYAFTVSISEPQISDTRVYLTQTGGNATAGEDFSFPSFVTIPEGQTTATDAISIHADDIIEETETVQIKIGTGLEANINGSDSETVMFNILNLEEGDLAISLSWDTEVYQTDGTEFEPTDIADLRLLVTDVPYTSVIGSSDEATFESYTLTSTSPDGEYYVIADWYSAADLGTQGTFPVSITADFNQIGVINDLNFSFVDALDSGNSCSSVYYIIAKITKTGENYDISEIGENSPVTAETFVGTATIIADDWADYAVGDQITLEAGATPYEFWIRAYNNPYISNPTIAYMIVTIDPLTGNVTVQSNEDFDYGCSEGDVTGNGNVNACAGTIDLLLNFGLGDCGDYQGNSFSLEL